MRSPSAPSPRRLWHGGGGEDRYVAVQCLMEAQREGEWSTAVSADIIFSFDSEDFETPAADEGELWWADALSRHGLTGCFCVVGELARALAARRRQDVLAAWARHEIGFHSDLHSAHPLHAEYLEECGWDDGVAAVMAREARGVAAIRRLTGRQPVAYCKPGSSWAPQVPAAMALLGVPVFCDAPVEWAPGMPMWYCDALCIKYHALFDRYFDVADRQRRLREDVQALLEQRRDGGVLVIYTHPCRLITTAPTDTFRFGIHRPRSAWRPAASRPRAQIAELMADFDAFLDWIARESGANVTTYGALLARCRDDNRKLPAAALGQLIAEADGPLVARRIGGHWLSPSEQLGVLLDVAAWQSEHGELPMVSTIRPLLGPDSQIATVAAGEVNTRELLAVASALSAESGRQGRIPAGAEVGRNLLGPAALLRTLARALRAMPERVALDRSDELPELARRPDFAGLRFHGGWNMFAPEFQAPHVLQMARLQTWSARPAM